MKAEGKRIKHSKKEHESFVSPETSQHQPTPIDLDHAVVNEGSLAGDEGRIAGAGENAHTQLDHSKHAVGTFEHRGEAPKRVVKKTKVAERHVSSKPGLEVGKERHSHVAGVRASREAENWSK